MVAHVPSPIARRVVLWGPGSLCGLAALAVAMSFRAGRPSDADRHDPQAVVSEWTSSGGVGGAHFSPLTEISRDNVRLLRVAWAYRTGDVSRGTAGISATSFQATPIIVDGTLYFPTPFSRVVALDAETGSERWVFDPRVDRSVTRRAYVTSRGVATWLDGTRSGTVCRRRIFVATVDARLRPSDGDAAMPFRDHAAFHRAAFSTLAAFQRAFLLAAHGALDILGCALGIFSRHGFLFNMEQRA